MPREEERIGTVIAGKYRIDGFVQKGGMGAVFSATHLDLGRKVAVKTFHRHLTDDNSLVVRFLNEAKGTSRINHRNVVDILDVGMDDEGFPFFVMEYLEGETLKDRLKRKGRLPLAESADIMIQVLQGLQAAHLMGIVHRDLKPGNLFLAREADGAETVKILDFGIARFMELEMEGRGLRTATGSLLGTPEYMSLEQARGIRDLIDHRTDIYSCGVILYVCLTGKSPLRGASQMDTIQNIAVKDVPPPSTEDSDLPAQVDAVIMKAMDRDKEKRFQDCASFINAMQVFYALATTLPARRSPHFVQAGSGAIMPLTGQTPAGPGPGTTVGSGAATMSGAATLDHAAETVAAGAEAKPVHVPQAAVSAPPAETLTPTPPGAVIPPGEAGREERGPYLYLLLALIPLALALLLGGGYLLVRLMRPDEAGVRIRGEGTQDETPYDTGDVKQETSGPDDETVPEKTAAAGSKKSKTKTTAKGQTGGTQDSPEIKAAGAGEGTNAGGGDGKDEKEEKKDTGQEQDKPEKDKKDKSKKKKGKGHGKSW